MKVFIALVVASLAIAAQAGHIPTSWPMTSSHGWNSWNGLDDGWTNGWNGVYGGPYGVNQWSSAWPATSLYSNGWHGRKTTVQANVAKVNPWGLPLAYGHGHDSYAYGANPWISSLHGGYNGDVQTVVQANVAKVNPWGLPLAYGNGYNNYWGSVPAAKYVASNPGAVHVAPLAGHAVSQKLIVA